MKLIRRHPLAALFVSLYGWFLLTAVTSTILAATGGGTTGREAAVIAAVCVLSLTGMAVSCWLYRRHERRRHEQFMAALDAPMPPSRLTVWTPPESR